MVTMRAKMKVDNIQEFTNCEVLTFRAVCKSEAYPDDGSDENNTFALWTPSATLTMTVNNPALHGQFIIGQEFYVDFTPAKGS